MPARFINQDTRFDRFNSYMSNLESHYSATAQGNRSATSRHAVKKWSSRRTLGFALLASGALWVMIFYVAKALIG
jgi:hypothetical protein